MQRSLRTPVLLLALAAGLLAGAAPGTAAAQNAKDAKGFGAKHQLILTADRLLPVLSYTTQTLSFNQGGQTREITESGTSIAFMLGREPALAVHSIPRVAFDFTIIKSLTLGGAFAFAIGLGGSEEDRLGNGSSKRDAPKTTMLGFAPRVGYILPLGEHFAFWPRAGFAFYSVSTTTQTVNNNNTVTNTDGSKIFSIDLDPQFAWTPMEHFFIHFGPLVNIPLSGSQSVENDVGPSSTTRKSDLSVFHFGVSAGLGGWFDL